MSQENLIKQAENIVQNEALDIVIHQAELGISRAKEIRDLDYPIKSLPHKVVSEKTLEGLSNYFDATIIELDDFKYIAFKRDGILQSFGTGEI